MMQTTVPKYLRNMKEKGDTSTVLETPVRYPEEASKINSVVRRSARRFTPFGRTPQSRFLGPRTSVAPSPQISPEVRKEQESNLGGLTFKTWKIFKMTPLFKFSSQPRDLRRYSNSLSSLVVAERDRGTFVENSVSGKAVFSVYKGLKKTPADPDAIQILIKGRARNGTVDTVQLTAVLCSVDMEENPLSKEMWNKFTYYPLLLVKGTVALTNTLITWLQSQFDCKVTPMVLASQELAWIIAMWSGTVSEPVSKSKPVELVYTVPTECEGMKKITYVVDPLDCQRLWECIHDGDVEEFTPEEVCALINSLEAHFYGVFKVKLPALYLTAVGTSLSYVGSDGRLKIFSKEHVLKVLRHFTELSVEHFQQRQF